MSEKTIVIDGKNNKYQMKKVLKNMSPKTKKGSERTNPLFYDFEYQKKMLEEEESECYQLMLKSIEKKINGYKQQDNLKNRFISVCFNAKDIIDLLKEKIECYYCNKKMSILYKNKRYDDQWTLDRINNDLSHDKSNVVIACLKCNMEKRCKDTSKFLFTKKMNIVKEC